MKLPKVNDWAKIRPIWSPCLESSLSATDTKKVENKVKHAQTQNRTET
jgi:hypothetical protein